MKQDQGFVLPVTVIMLALVSVGIALMSHRSDETRALVIEAREEQKAVQLVERTRAEALYLSSALYRRLDSLGTIKLDGRFYRTEDGVMVSYQDGGSLFNLRRARRDELLHLFQAVGFTDGLQMDQLADRLLDYTDTDDLQHINGAERPDYQQARMPVPRNERLATPSELQRLLGWKDLPEGPRQALLDHVYIGPQRTVNRYTVTAPVLSAISGMDPAAAQQLVDQRIPGTPVRIESAISQTGGSYLAEGRYIIVPSSTLLVRICVPGRAWCQHLSMTSTGESPNGPWHADYGYRLPRTKDLPPAKDVEALPNQLPDKPPPPLYSPFANSLP
ncbi:general secretion pathway protein GspK [Pelomonas sp. BJYL3]|uniref:general secretion pathway protein GspK n=1 Tax=Pelomonas sp. BJYL3 TaxID=2976697 RepID=UPI0022B4665F|nr:type II secretion system protein GspK [Pelomonas sp. BJYL3]